MTTGTQRLCELSTEGKFRCFQYLSLIALLVANQVLAQAYSDELVQRTNSYSKAKLNEAIAPKYPNRVLRSLEEGWVALSYLVRRTGEVQS